jgi:pimeloyl-ACP methyl ester carboxylesterase
MTAGYAPVNGVDMYWESRGEGGIPLVVVHGGYGRTTMFGDLLAEFARDREVIAIELQGHGHTRDTGRRFTWADFGDDIAALIKHLGVDQVDLLGYSLGGGACLRAAIQHQGLFRRLVLISAPCRRDAWYPEVRAGFDQMNRVATAFLSQSPAYDAYAEVAPDPEAFPALIDQTGQLLRQPYDWSQEVRQLTLPVLLAYADADAIPPAQAAEFFALLGGGQRDAGVDGSAAPTSRLAILPGRTHYDILQAVSLGDVVANFLK